MAKKGSNINRTFFKLSLELSKALVLLLILAEYIGIQNKLKQTMKSCERGRWGGPWVFNLFRSLVWLNTNAKKFANRKGNLVICRHKMMLIYYAVPKRVVQIKTGISILLLVTILMLAA